MITTAITCPICKLEEQSLIQSNDFGRNKNIKCQRCGKYSITSTAQEMVGDGRLGYKLIAWIRDVNVQNNSSPEITSDVLINLEKGIPDYSPMQKQLIFLRNIERLTKFPGQPVDIVPDFDYPLSWATNVDELLYYLRNLVERNFIRIPAKEGHEEINTLLNIVEITASGWEFLKKKL